MPSLGENVQQALTSVYKVPIQSKLVDFSLLTKEETAWLEAHNKLCYEKLRPLLKKAGDKRAAALLGKFFKCGSGT
jgi:hypothetical protein